MMKLILWNGARTQQAWNPKSKFYVDDIKPHERTIECTRVQVTYGCDLKWYDVDDVQYSVPIRSDGFIRLDGVFYGDFSVTE